ncbi:DUF397 domain-containing protein [Nocardia sp. CY41]|uniref:DUF397 domain-containing protein n=1 Tax=Nocardia sp. CY41 TaxID=2608686 RepID=UPI0013580FA3|nr:DUF397 domain-containing protein [Nocardia sp. CY41]
MTGHRPLDGYIKSSYSDGGGQCVLVRRFEGEQSVFIRDTKYLRDPRNRPEEEPIIEMPAEAWNSFEALVLGASTGEAVPGLPEVEFTDRGHTLLRGADGTTLEFTGDEWIAFRAGVIEREFEPQAAAA